MIDWTPPGHWPRISTIDVHTAGEPLRVILSGFGEPKGDTILARRRFALAEYDHLRRAMLLEPRGHADMYACLPVPAATPDGDFGVLFLHNAGYSTMCGHGIIGIVTVALECRLFELDSEQINIDTPAGRVVARAEWNRGRVARVSFVNVPAFLLEADVACAVEGIGEVRYDLGFGGAFYAYVDACSIDLPLAPTNVRNIRLAGMNIKEVVTTRGNIRHPAGEDDLNFLYGVVFYDDSIPGVFGRNVCVFADGEIDRSPTGTGISGRAAVLHARNRLGLHQSIRIESLIQTTFDVKLIGETTVARKAAVIPEVTGSAHITGRHEFVIDPDDPLQSGFLLH